MEKTRYFSSCNKFNVNVNFLTGNDFPLTDEKESLSLGGLIWFIFVSMVKFMFMLSTALGTYHFAELTVGDMFTRSGSMTALCIELIIPTVYMNIRRKDLHNLIKHYNDILIDSDDLRNFLQTTFAPYKKGFTVCVCTSFCTNILWSGIPISRIFHADRFTYADFTVPAYLPGEPFGIYVFSAGVAFAIAGASTISFGKCAVDLYVCHFIAVLTAQYKYVRLQLAEALRQDKDDIDELTVIAKLQTCIRHHCAVIENGQILGDILALHVGVTYIGVICKFCFLAFGLVTLGGHAIIAQFTYALYTTACLIQVFMICSSIHELYDTSTSVTEDAFHENWHARGNAVKKIFCTIEVSSQMACRISAYRIVELIVPTMAVILSKSYSLCLLLLTVG